MAKQEIEINKKRYSIACAPGHEERVARLGQKLDRRVRTIADTVGDIGDTRLFLIAALALLDDADVPEGAMLAEIEDKAASALQDAATRIEALASKLEGGRANT